MGSDTYTIAYLQLPLLDNDTQMERENFPLAALYLDYSLERAGLSQACTSHILSPETDGFSNRKLVDHILTVKPDLLVATLYVWNVERTLRVLKEIRRILPGVRIICGGPEVDHQHPFLFNDHIIDAFVVGDGESVFPDMVAACQAQCVFPDYRNVGKMTAEGIQWGKTKPPPVSLAEALPPYERFKPFTHLPVMYMETSRGCPLRCAYCRYHHLHDKVYYLTPEQISERIVYFLNKGVKEVRFIDPTFNSHPRFTDILRQLVTINPHRDLSFFAEVKADMLTSEQIELLDAANFAELEIGVQSIGERVLATINRPTRMARLETALKQLAQTRIKLTLDVMYGLPLQSAEEVMASIQWCRQFPKAQVQCMQTLLLPGTDLRTTASGWGIHYDSLPPYGVVETGAMTRDDVQKIEQVIFESDDLPTDPVTPRFVGYRLRELFKSKVTVDVWDENPDMKLKIVSNRTRIEFRGDNLFGRVEVIASLIQRCIQEDPDALWQFVLCPSSEEPLDLLEELAAVVRKAPLHFIDRFASVRRDGHSASRRIYVRLNASHDYDAEWVEAVEAFLRTCYY